MEIKSNPENEKLQIRLSEEEMVWLKNKLLAGLFGSKNFNNTTDKNISNSLVVDNGKLWEYRVKSNIKV